MRTRPHEVRHSQEIGGERGTPEALPSEKSVKTVLLVDDQDECRITTKWFLANFGYIVVTAQSAEEALALFVPEVHDVVLTDNTMLGLTGTEMAHIIKLRSPCTPVVMYTGLPPSDTSCLDVVIIKPAHQLVLKEAIDDLLAGWGPVTTDSPHA